MKELILGCDDAGRGPVIGPMILSGCLMDRETEKEFKTIGVKDSKQLTQKRREFLEKIIKEKSKAFHVVIIEPSEIDGEKANGIKLNELEAIKFAEAINKINDGKEKITVVVDCPSPTISKWADFLKTKIDNLSNLTVSCEHKADKNHTAVAAASILAKSVREREMAKLREKYPEIGSGYPSDSLTCRFLEKYALKYKKDGIFRQTWSTWQRACAARAQKTLV